MDKSIKKFLKKLNNYKLNFLKQNHILINFFSDKKRC